ncbi:hypothetical protein KA005_62045 [bacterium]|nr:hypothetical protein [bacterium]
MNFKQILFATVIFSSMILTQCTGKKKTLPFQNPSLDIEARVNDLVDRLTLEEKISQMQNNAAAIPGLDIPEYNWWNECLHGVGFSGTATVFPQAIGLAATWNTQLMGEVATAISDEARAKHHEAIRKNQRKIFQGIGIKDPVSVFLLNG